MIEFVDEESGKTYQFITNIFRIAASSIAEIYKQRWQIELFFKWIKQNLKIKSFLGTSENAVMSQIWVAMIHYLLIAYLKFLHGSSSTKQTIGVLEIFNMDDQSSSNTITSFMPSTAQLALGKISCAY